MFSKGSLSSNICKGHYFSRVLLLKSLLSMLITFAIGQLIAQKKLGLEDAIQIGLEKNYQIKIAERNLEIAQTNNDWAIAGRYPSINLNANLNNSYTNNNNPISFVPEINSWSTGLIPSAEVNWVLFDGYRIRFTKKQLEELEAQSEGNAKLAVENTIQSIILAYYNVLIQREQTGILQEVLALSRDRIDYQNVRKEFGQSGTFDLLQAQDAYYNDSISYVSQVNNFTNAIRSLNLAMGEDQADFLDYFFSDSLSYNPVDYDLSVMETKMLENNQTLKNQYINRDLAFTNRQIVEGAKYPTISARGGMSYNYSLSTGSGTTNAGETLSLDVRQRTFNGFVNFTVSYNLFDFGIRKRRMENAKIEELVTQLNIDDLKLNLKNQLANTLAAYNNQKELVIISEELLKNAKRNLNISEERFKGGIINSFDYRTVQLGYINASQSRLNAIFNLKNTETELIRLIGGLLR